MDQEIFIAKNKYISSKRSAELYGYTHDYLSRLAKNGVIKGQKFGRAWYLDESSLKQFVEDAKIEKEIQSEDKSQAFRKEYKETIETGGPVVKKPLLTQNRSLSKYVSHLPKIVYSKPFEKALTLAFAGTLVFGIFFFEQTPNAHLIGNSVNSGFSNSRDFIDEGLSYLAEKVSEEKVFAASNIKKNFLAGAAGFKGFADSVISGEFNFSEFTKGYKNSIDNKITSIKNSLLGTPEETVVFKKELDSKLRTFKTGVIVIGEHIMDNVLEGRTVLALLPHQFSQKIATSFNNYTPTTAVGEKFVTAGALDSLSGILGPGFYKTSRTIYCSINRFFKLSDTCMESGVTVGGTIVNDTEEDQTEVIATEEIIKTATPEQSTSTTETIVIEGPTQVVERVTERVVTADGIDQATFDAALKAMRDELRAELYIRLGNINTGQNTIIQNVYNSIAQSNKIDRLQEVDIIDSIITGGTITSNEIFGVFRGSIDDSSSVTTARLQVEDKLGVATTSPYGMISVVGTSSPAFVAGGTAGTTNFIITANGEVGVATTSPFTRFAVVGDSYLDGGLTTTGTFTSGAVFSTGTSTFGGLQTAGLLAGNYIETPVIYATSTTATSTIVAGLSVSTLSVGSTTATSTFANGIQLSSGCFRLPDGTCAGSGGDNFAWTPATNYGENTNSTTTPLWIQENIYASSTIYAPNFVAAASIASTLPYASSTAISVSGISFLTNILATASSTLQNFTALQSTTTQATTTSFFATTASSTNLSTSNFTLANINGPLQAIAGAVSASTTLREYVGGTGTTSPSQFLFGNGTNIVSTSTIAQNFIDNALARDSEVITLIASAFPFTPATNYGENTNSTTTPLWIQENIYASSTIYAPTFSATDSSATTTLAGGLAIETSGFVYDFSTNNVGIGTATPASLLTISGAGAISQIDTTSAAYAKLRFSEQSASKWGLEYSTDRDNIEFYSHDLSATALVIDDTTGFVGIGSDNYSPTYLLDVAGAGKFTSYVDASHFVATSSTASIFTGGFLSSASSTLQNFTALQSTTTQATTTSLAITSIPNSLLSTNATGGVVGTTTIGQNFIPDLYLRNDANDTTTGNLTAATFIGSNASATSTLAGGLAIETSGFVYDFSTNRVGIGTASPSQKLHVAGSGEFSGSGNIGLNINAGDVWDSRLRFQRDGTSNWVVWSSSANGNLEFAKAESSGQVLSLKSDGNVGIASTTPGYRLSVEGIISGSSLIAASSTATSTLAGGLDVAYLNQTGGSATSTFATGIDLATGCFAINGTCVGGGGGGGDSFAWTPATNYGENTNSTTTPLWIQENIYASSTIYAPNFVAAASIASTLPYASSTAISVSGISFLTNILATASSTLQNFTALQATTTQATTTSFAITSLTNSLLSTNATGGVVGTTTIGQNFIPDLYLRNDADDTTTGNLTAATFIGSNASATSTLAGGLAIETSGFVYDFSTNRVGIGTASPDSFLHISGSGNSLHLNDTRTNAGAQILFNSGGAAGDGAIGYASGSHADLSSDTLYFQTNDSVRATLDSSGNFSVGTTTAYSKLTAWGTDSLFEAVNNSSTTIFSIAQTGATTTSFAITSLTNSLLSTNATGGVVGTTTIGQNFIPDLYLRNDGNDTTSGVITSAGLTITTGNALTLGSTRWDNGSDLIDGERIADDTIDDDSIDLVDITLADFTNDADFVTWTSATSSLWQTSGLLSTASSTIGGGTKITGLTVSGNATTTLDLIVSGGDITLGTTNILSGGDTASLNNIDAIDGTTESTFEAAIDSLVNLVTVGALNSGSITSGFGSIDLGSDIFTTTGLGTLGNLLATASSTLQNFTALQATTTQATTTSLAITSIPNSLLSTNATGGVVGTTTIGQNFIPDLYLRNDANDTTTGNLTAATFIGSNASATSTLAGGLAIETSGFVYDFSTNRVGIGTASPDSNLHIYQDSPSSNQILFRIGTSDDSSRFSVDEDGDTLIDSSLRIAGTATAGLLGLQGNTGGAADFFHLRDDSDGADLVFRYDGSNVYQVRTEISGGGNLLLALSNAGNVGVGQSSPTYKLDVTGEGRFTSYVDASYFTGTSTTATSTIAGVFSVGSSTPAANTLFSVGTSTQNLFVNKTSGSVGIGGVVSPLNTLSVAGSGMRVTRSNNDKDNPIAVFGNSQTANNYLSIYGGVANGDPVYVGTNYWSSDGQLRLGTYTTPDTIALATDGKVGVGTTSPAFLLDVDGDFRVGEAGSSEALFVDATNGLVGLGTSSPAQKLSVQGNGYITGGLGVGKTNTSAGTLSTTGNISTDADIISSLLNCNAASSALQTDGAGTITCGAVTAIGGTSAGGWTWVNPNYLKLATTSDRVVIGSSGAPTEKLEVHSGSTATTTLGLHPAAAQTANIIDIYNTSGAIASVFTSGQSFGIGTTSPTDQLAVDNDIYIGGNGGTGTSTFEGNLHVRDTLQVGTGSTYLTTTNVNVGSGGAYSIDGTSVLNATTLGGAVVNSSLTSTGALDSGSITSNFGSIDTGSSAITTTGTVTGGNLVASNASATSTFAGGLAVDTSGLVYDHQTGFVGIGTATANRPLYIYNNNSSVGSLLQLETGPSGNFAVIGFTDSRASGVNWNIEVGRSVGDLDFYSGTAGRVMTITDDGNVAIGSDTTPDAKLEIVDGGSDIFQISSSVDADGDYVTVDSSGNFGIGTTSPFRALSVAGFINTDQYSGFQQDGVTILTASTTNNTISIGEGAGTSTLASGVKNNFFGYWAGQANTTGTGNVVIGYNSFITATSSLNNIAIGQAALQSLITNVNNDDEGSVAIGHKAGTNITYGGGNTLLGYRAGDAITTGSQNLIIGYDIDAPSNTDSNQLSIGNLIFGTGVDGTGTSISSGNIGIATTTPTNRLAVEGTGYFAGDLIATGLTATGTVSLPSASVTKTNIANSGTLSFDWADSEVADDLTIDSSAAVTAPNFVADSGSATSTLAGGLTIATSGGNVGINDSTPDALLSVEGDVGINTGGTANPNASRLYIEHGASQEGLHIRATSASEWSPINVLDDGGGVAFQIDQNADGVIAGSFIVNEEGGDNDFRVESDNNTHLFFTDASANRVGVASSSPGYLLSVEGIISGSSLIAASSTATSTFAGGLAIETSGFVYDLSTNNVGIGNASPAAVLDIVDDGGDILHVSSSAGADGDYLTVDSSGQVGIGTTSPSTLFAVHGSSNGLYVTSAGKLGIGKANPSNLLDIQSGSVAVYPTGADQGFILYRNNSTSAKSLEIYNDGSGTEPFFDSENASYHFAVSGTERWTFKSTGEFGIGDTSPDATLDVVGNTLLDSNLITFASSSATTLNINYAAKATSTIVSGSPYAWTLATSTTALPIVEINTTTGGRLATTTINSGLVVDSGAITYDYSSGVTSIDNLDLGALNFDDNAGVVSWVNLPVSTTTANLVQSYTAYLDSKPLLTLYGVTDGYGSVATTTKVGIASTTPWGRFSVEQGADDLATFVVADEGTTTPHLLVNGRGFVGVGTSSPFAKFSVAGSIFANESITGSNITATGTLAVTGAVTLSNTTSGLIEADSSGVLTASSTIHDFYISDAITISSSGSVDSTALTDGGTISFDWVDAEVADDLTIDSSNAVTAPNFVADSGSATSTFAGGIAVETSGLVYDFSTGFVGIGTAAPTERLMISDGSNDPIIRIDPGGSGSVNPILHLADTNDSAGFQLHYQNNQGRTYFKNLLNQSADQAAFYFQTETAASAIDVLTIESHGDTGISTTSPWGLLSVNPNGISGPSFVVGSSTQTDFIITNGGLVGIGTTTPGYKFTVEGAVGGLTALIGTSSSDTLVVGGGLGKLTAGTIDPVYSIGDSKYSTYVAGIIGIKEEVAGTAEVNTEVTDENGNVGYVHEIDFDEQDAGGDLWLFSKATEIRKNIDQLIVLLTPEGGGNVWYEIDKHENKLVLLSDKPAKVSYRLTAPRFDWKKWTNFNQDAVNGFEVPEYDDGSYFEDEGDLVYDFSGVSNESEALTIDKVLDKLAELGTAFVDGVVKIASLVVDNLTIGSSSKPTGITLYDELTGEPYCLSVRGGETVSRAGACGTQTNETGNSETEETESGDNEAPVVTVNGNNPAQIEVGTSYADLGASVTDNVDSNLGITASVNGEDVGSISNIQIDTSEAGEYTITYSATDQAGNVGTAERTVVVGNLETGNQETEEVVIETEETGNQQTGTTTPEVVEEEQETAGEAVN